MIERYQSLDELHRNTQKEWCFVQSPKKLIGGVCIDLEKTLITDPDWIKSIREIEIEILAKKLDWKNPGEKFTQERTRVASLLGLKKVSVSYLASTFGISTSEWSRLKAAEYNPEQFEFNERNDIKKLLFHLNDLNVPYGIMTNTPDSIVKRILNHIGVNSIFSSQFRIFTPDSINIAKPADGYFENIFSVMKIDPSRLLVFGDDPEKDLKRPIELGTAAVYATSPVQVEEAVTFMDQVGAFI